MNIDVVLFIFFVILLVTCLILQSENDQLTKAYNEYRVREMYARAEVAVDPTRPCEWCDGEGSSGRWTCEVCNGSGSYTVTRQS